MHYLPGLSDTITKSMVATLSLTGIYGYIKHVSETCIWICIYAYLLAIWFQRPRIRILHSAEEDNLPSVDSISLPCCQCIKITTKKYAYCQSQGWSHVGSGVEWTECSLITGAGYWVQVWSSIAQSVCQRAFSLLKIWFQRPWVRLLHSAEEDNLSHSIRYNFPLASVCTKKGINKYVCMSPHVANDHVNGSLNSTQLEHYFYKFMISPPEKNIVKIVKNKCKFTLLPMHIITWWFSLNISKLALQPGFA